jgi:AbrB family looped-hinge helix DNA binding protein
MRVKVSVKGQIVIPAELRAKYAIAPGDVVDVRDGDGKILVFPLPKDVIRASRGFLKGPTSLTAALLKARAEEQVSEDLSTSTRMRPPKKPR